MPQTPPPEGEGEDSRHSKGPGRPYGKGSNRRYVDGPKQRQSQLMKDHGGQKSGQKTSSQPGLASLQHVLLLS